MTLGILGNIANVFIKKGLYDSAWNYFQLAFDQVRPGMNESGLLKRQEEDFQSDEMRYLVNLVVDKADGKQKQFDETLNREAIKEAIAVYRAGDQLLARISAEQSDFESKLFWRSATQHLYENAIQACFKIGDVADGFYFFERSRAVLLAEQLNQRKYLAENEILKLAELKKRIFQIRKDLLTKNPVSSEYADVKMRLDSQSQEYDRQVDIIRFKNPVYYQSVADTSFPDLAGIRKNLLHDHQALVEFYSGDSAIYTILITNSSAGIERISKDDYEDLVAEYRRYLANDALLNKDFIHFATISNRLYQLIFKNSPIPDGRIIVSLGGESFPLEALITDDKKSNYFLTTHAVSYTYSARFLLNEFKTGVNSSSSDFIGVAPLNFASYMMLQGLPGSDLSLRNLKPLFKAANNLVGPEASRANFLKQFPLYKIVQLYTHAIDTSIAGEPMIWFADSALYLSELAGNQKPATDLIVLSACQTALGNNYKGEGVFSFSRAFAALGIPSSITNLWSVDNEATYKLTELFYHYLRNHEPLDVALQKAKLEFLKGPNRQYSLPYFWAAPILAGKSEAPVLQRSHSAKWAIICACLAIALLISVWYWKR